ncbi:MAG: hypothetical protein FJZ00_02630 [Candidatus Sericytochromatia bacterium]|uniref:Uncharacterized protein n=1 Tax=Candidatus Tanganyikabacteria bacterium TaxID=2961651 RepID=A0A938BI49_9BACT|nr:hypothetical protein [Candidatus Tanganyikabacteria bacterium]
MEDIADLVELVELFIGSQVGELDEFERQRARRWAEGFTYLPQRAFVTQMSAAIDLVYAWTALNAPCVARPPGKIVQLAPYLYRKCTWGQAH